MLACDAIRPHKPIATPSGRRKTLAPVHPNVGVAISFQRRLDALIHAMHVSLTYWLKAAYRKANPILAQDDRNAAFQLQRDMEKLGKRWLDRFETVAPELARYFATAARDRVDGSLAHSLRQAGISVKFQMSPAMREAFEATVAENVSLIKSVATTHLNQVQQAVMRSVTAGRDVGALAKDLEARYGVTKRRAAFIARSQNNIASSTMTAVRQRELGIVDAIWTHSSAGRHPRPSHIAANGKTYKVKDGMELEEHGVLVKTWPGRLPNCRCVSKSVIPALQ